MEKTSSLAAQAHFGLAGPYRKQGKTAEAEREMQEFQKLQDLSTLSKDRNWMGYATSSAIPIHRDAILPCIR